MNFTFDNERPIYIQLVEQLEIYIVSGKLASSERIPSVRDLALSSKVNPNTMQRALASLEEEGLIYTERTNGKYVTKDKKLLECFKGKYAESIKSEYISKMGALGYSKDEAIEYLESEKGKK